MRYTSLLSFFALALLLSACGSNDAATDSVTQAEEPMAEEKPMAVTLTPMPATQEFPDAAITDWQYQDGKFMYTATGYEFAAPTPDADALMCANSGKGQHAHLIINNEPYIAKYESTFELDLPDGDHHILTFLSRSYHESIKTEPAHRAVLATVENKSFTKTMDIEAPMLFYSRPKGTYTGAKATTNVMLDFYPVNVTIGEDGYAVKAVVNGGEPMMITEWKPYFLKNLPMGENTVELTLMKDEAMVEAPLNPVTRTFTLQEDPAGE